MLAQSGRERNLLTETTAIVRSIRTGEGVNDSELIILVVDDSPFQRKLVEQSLSNAHQQILFAKNGHEALQAFGDKHPEVVITDWSMPDVSGPELCRRIRRDFRQHYAYIILVTSNSDKTQVIAGLSAGADDYVTKPFDPGELLARVGVGQRIIQLHREIEAKNRQLEQLALTDPLTGLPNRRAVDLWVDSHLSSAARHDFSMWVVMADLDHFKRVNDTYGHEAGDNVLKTFAAILKANTRRSNICSRLGGEEFLVILTHTNEEQTRTAVERIRKRLAMEKFRFGDATATVTASFGIAGFAGNHAPEFDGLLARADDALYVAKNKGRNRMEFHPEDDAK
jgi:two-component system, cell cycle response regulator